MSSSKNIMVVEDEKMLLEIIAFHLFDAGYNVIEASNGKEALDYFRREDVDILITDIRMPILNGRQLMTEVFKQKILPVIVFTGFSDVPARILRDEGAMKVLHKPLNISHILKLVESNSAPSLNAGPSLVKNLEQTVVLEIGENQPHICFGRHGFFLQAQKFPYRVGEIIDFSLKISPTDDLVKGQGRIYFKNDNKVEPRLDNQGYMVEITGLAAESADYRRFVRQEDKHKSIPFLGSIMNKGNKNAV